MLTWGVHCCRVFKRASALGSHSVGLQKVPEHLTPSTSKCNKWKAWNSLCERGANADGGRRHGRASVRPGYPSRCKYGPTSLFGSHLTWPHLIFSLFCLIRSLSSKTHLSSTQTIVPPSAPSSPPRRVPLAFLFIPISHFPLPCLLPSSISHFPRLACSLPCFAMALAFSPVGLCVCCNELYLIANWDPQP